MPIYQGKGGQWYLTTREKKRILLNNIYGVDIDSQAVEVTKLSLLLKVLENENQDTLERQMKLWRERALPDLGNNIKCGNSLIGPDFYDGEQLTLLDDEEQSRINAFDWNAEFPKIMQKGGFNAVIGNPPYVRQEELGQEKAYFQLRYRAFCPTADLYVNFIEKGISLLDNTGFFGMIVSNKWLRSSYGRSLREFLSSNASVLQIIDLAGLPVFPNATVRTIVLICKPQTKSNKELCYLPPLSMEEFQTVKSGERLQFYVEQRATNLPISQLSADGWSLANADITQIIDKMRQAGTPLKTYIHGKTFFGIKTGFNKAFIVDREIRDKLIAQDPKSNEIIKPLLAGRDIQRYSIKFKERFLIWTYIGIQIDEYPVIYDYLKQFKSKLEKRWDKGNFWWELRACGYYEQFEKPKIIYPDISK